MARLIVLLRGVNLAGRNRVGMPQLREALEESGFENVSTYVQSGNVVLSSKAGAKRVGAEVEQLIAKRFDLDIKVLVRTRAQLAAVVNRNPLGKVAKNPKLYQVTFLDRSPEPAAVEKLRAVAIAGEEVVHEGLELYTWHPAGIGRSKLARLLSGKELGASATARNWSTVTALLDLADES